MKVSKIIKFISPISCSSFKDYDIETIKSINDLSFNFNSLGWCSDGNIEILKSLKGGTVLISQNTENELTSRNIDIHFNKIIVDNPRKSFAEILREFFIEKVEYGKVHTSSVIDASVNFDLSKVVIGPNVVIEKNVILGSFVIIEANTVLKAGTIIHDNVKIGSNCTIGGVGFGYEPNDNGVYELIPHIGNVILKEFVEIGNNVCIDRAVIGSTILEKEVKIDNLVHIAHGVHIESNSLIIAHAMIAGSVKIGKNTWVAPCSAIKQKVSIGDNVIIGLGSVVLKDVQNNEVVVGVPAKNIIK